MRNTSVLVLISALIQIPNLFQELAMLDAGASEPKKMIEKKKYPWVVNVLKEFVGATTIT